MSVSAWRCASCRAPTSSGASTASSRWCRWARSRAAIRLNCRAASSSAWRWPARSWSNRREEMRFEIRRLHDEFKITTVYVTHDQSEAMVTSDRIVVMNKGRIEQVDAPHTLYGRPRSRFVAGFIGRTNFVDRDGGSYSIRPQAIGLSTARPTANGVEAEIVDRAYLGEHWDYQVKPLGEAKPLRVATGPNA